MNDGANCRQMEYRVLVDDNYHYMDKSERTRAGVYASAPEALSAAQQIVDESLRRLHKPGFTADDLYKHYKEFGEDPFIVSDDPTCTFSAWTYAKDRCAAVCVESATNAKSDKRGM
jgi:hypothetical protein